MNYLSVKDFIEAGKTALDNGNYWGALSIALMLPSICSRIEYENKSEYKKDKGGWQDKQCYVDFCKLLFCKNGWLISTLGEKYPEVLYELRCDIIHAGEVNVNCDELPLFLQIGGGADSTSFTGCRMIKVETLSDEIFSEVKSWFNDGYGKKVPHTQYFDLNKDSDDKLLYKALCEEDRKKNC